MDTQELAQQLQRAQPHRSGIEIFRTIVRCFYMQKQYNVGQPIFGVTKFGTALGLAPDVIEHERALITQDVERAWRSEFAGGAVSGSQQARRARYVVQVGQSNQIREA